jgi:hypothetical protein
MASISSPPSNETNPLTPGHSNSQTPNEDENLADARFLDFSGVSSA